MEVRRVRRSARGDEELDDSAVVDGDDQGLWRRQVVDRAVRARASARVREVVAKIGSVGPEQVWAIRLVSSDSRASAARRSGLSCRWWRRIAAGKELMAKLLPAPDRFAVTSVPHEPSSVPRAGKPERAEAARTRPPAVQFVGFHTTDRGREYTLSASGAEEPRLFVLLIPSAEFESHSVRFQDGPDLCFRRLNRELAADPDLLPGGGMVLTSEELRDYRAGREQPAVERRRRGNHA